MTEASEDAVARHLARNEKLLEALDRHSADRAIMRSIDFFFYASDRPQALALAESLRAAGFENVTVGEQPRDGQWSIQAVRIDTIDAVIAEGFVQRLVAVAAKHSADFDGWGTSV